MKIEENTIIRDTIEVADVDNCNLTVYGICKVVHLINGSELNCYGIINELHIENGCHANIYGIVNKIYNSGSVDIYGVIDSLNIDDVNIVIHTGSIISGKQY